jgi:hypothetical protein
MTCTPVNPPIKFTGNIVSKESIRITVNQFSHTVEEYTLSPPKGEGVLLGKNGSKRTKKYPKVNSLTGERLYARGWYWQNGLKKSSCKFYLVDEEYANEFNEKGFRIYTPQMGWAKPGYYWCYEEIGKTHNVWIQRVIVK